MRYEGKSLFECVRCPMCTCRQLPPYGNFTVGLDYAFDYIIDARKVTDNLRETITLPEAVFLSCFENLGEAVTSFSPIHSDTTEYHLYLVLRGGWLQPGGNQGICKGHECELSPGKRGIDAEGGT